MLISLLSLSAVTVIGAILSIYIDEKEEKERYNTIMERIDERIIKECKSKDEYVKYRKIAEIEVRKVLAEKL